MVGACMRKKSKYGREFRTGFPVLPFLRNERTCCVLSEEAVVNIGARSEARPG